MKRIKQRIKTGIFLILCFFVPSFCIPNTSAVSASTNPPDTTLNATLESTATESAWLALVHYRPRIFGIFGGYKSSIDSDAFFLAKNGKTNPLAELRATINLFNNPMGENEKKCLFPARYTFLKQRGLIQADFPICTEYEQFRKDLNPAGITLIYTDAYMNNPSSLFGHTLMRIDIPEGKTQLVAHGMNYGAYVDEKTAGALYAVYGLTGGYWGGFTIKPYYQIINTYNNLENRDIWEYSLNLTPQERDFFVAHLWELGHTQTRYYFFTKNCSYLLMEVMDAVRPSLKLSDDFPMQTIPLDTVKAVNKRPTFVKKANYRPSRQRRIAYRYDKMTSSERRALIAYLQEDDTTGLETLSESSRIAVLDTAYEYIQYQWIKQDIPLKEYRQKSFEVLRARRNINQASSEVIVPGENPINAHDSMRASFSFGSNRGQIFEEIGWRAAYHALVENPSGLLRGAEINFLDTVIRYTPQTQQLHLQDLTLVKISSMAPYNALFHPISYQIDTGILRKWDAKRNKEGTVYRLSGGSGLTFNPLNNLYVYGLIHTRAEYGGGFYRHPFGLSLGITGGLIYYLPKTQIQTEIARNFSDNRLMNTLEYKVKAIHSLSKEWALGLSYHFENQKYHSDNTLKATIYRYF